MIIDRRAAAKRALVREESRDKMRERWHHKFAWLPHEVGDNDVWVWLGWYERRWIDKPIEVDEGAGIFGGDTYDDPSYWEEKLLPDRK